MSSEVSIRLMFAKPALKACKPNAVRGFRIRIYKESVHVRY